MISQQRPRKKKSWQNPNETATMKELTHNKSKLKNLLNDLIGFHNQGGQLTSEQSEFLAIL